MATLQTIRTKAGILVAIVIGISLAAFILGDMLQSGNSLFRRNQLEIAEIKGESIQYPEFQHQAEELGEIYQMNTGQNQLNEENWVQIREQAWQNIVRKKVMDDVYKDLGITVSSDELFDMLQGTNLHPIVQQLFRNPNTGQVDRGAVVRFLQNLETGVSPEQREYWLYLESQIAEERLHNKYNTLVGKGLYVTTQRAGKNMEESNKQINFDYIMLPNSSVADSQVTLTDKELRDYYDAHKNDYEQEKIRMIEFITFPVTPSEQDFQDAEAWINEIVEDFARTNDNVSFVNSNSDVSFDNTWYKKEELPEDIATWIFETDAETGSILGPYFEDNSYKLAKLHASEMMPDSVEARHILLDVATREELAARQELADSLKTAIEGGSNFNELAMEYSKDRGSAMKGGELGWFSRGDMVEPFEEAAFSNAINEVSVVVTQHGIHVIQTTGRGRETRQVQVAYLIRKVVPSTKTYQNVYAQASKFAGNNTNKDEFDAAIAEQNLNKKVATINENDRQIQELENARPLIRAAFDTDVGKMIQDPQGSTIFDLGDTYVIATLVSATDEGIADFEDVKQRIELAVLKQKKTEFLMQKMEAALEGKSDLESIASELGTSVENALNVNFNSLSIPGAGLEPALAGTAFAMEPGKISGPVAGNNGVFIVEVTSVNEADDQVPDLRNEQMRLSGELAYRAFNQAYQAHRDNVEIVDKRSKFY
jgi:peptidyl-prolyl cis-trans isomerase D